MISTPKPLDQPPRGLVLYHGPSEIDGEPIVSIATLHSENRKTGPMVQVWFLRADVNPVVAIHTGADRSVCGSCPLRGHLKQELFSGHHLGIGEHPRTTCRGRACYVQVDRASKSIWFAWRRGNYPYISPANASYVTGRYVRLGAYGDPAAVPLESLLPILNQAAGHTGYTHQWRVAKHLRPWVNASTHTEDESREAISLGWRVFQTADKLPAGLKWCPADRMQCHACRACRGSSGRNMAIKPHGGICTLYSFAKLQA